MFSTYCLIASFSFNFLSPNLAFFCPWGSILTKCSTSYWIIMRCIKRLLLPTVHSLYYYIGNNTSMGFFVSRMFYFYRCWISVSYNNNSNRSDIWVKLVLFTGLLSDQTYHACAEHIWIWNEYIAKLSSSNVIRYVCPILNIELKYCLHNSNYVLKIPCGYLLPKNSLYICRKAPKNITGWYH